MGESSRHGNLVCYLGPLNLCDSLPACASLDIQGSLPCSWRWVHTSHIIRFTDDIAVTAAAELVGKTIFSQGLASSFRPRRYYTIPRETLEASLEDVEQLINFFVIEFQRIVFAENVFNTTAVRLPHSSISTNAHGLSRLSLRQYWATGSSRLFLSGDFL